MSSSGTPLPNRESSADRKRRFATTEPEHQNSAYQPPSNDPPPRMFNGSTYRTAFTNSAGSNRDATADFNSLPRQPPSRYEGMSRRPSNQYYQHYPVRRESEIVLPRWQPDSEVDKCPVCNSEFSLFFRKHHCRKCGRVVCSSCSPHRITIPRQYIVQPPNPYAEEMDDMSPVGGGEVVRVCKPCVPDPWTPNAGSPATSPFANSNNNSAMPRRSTVPDTRGAAPRDHDGNPRRDSRFGTSAYPISSDPQVRRNLNLTSQPPALPWPLAPTQEQRWSLLERERNLARERGASDSRSGRLEHLSHEDRYALEIERMNAVSRDNRHPTRPHRHSHAAGVPYDMFSAPWMPGPSAGGRGEAASPSSRPTPPPPHSSSAASHPVPRRRQVAEEDECPVCGEEMAPGEAVREAHITECIASRSAFGSAPPASSMLAATPSPLRVSSFTPSPAASETTRPRATSYRPRGMAVYKATEKDCTTEEGEPQECVICFEEFQPGDELGRMECWCKFHRVCIRRWWETKGGGSCPTHQLHE